jgi:hypothetical protein
VAGERMSVPLGSVMAPGPVSWKKTSGVSKTTVAGEG